MDGGTILHEAVIIIGGGQAGAEAATQLRQGGFAGRIILLGEEASLPYQRPPLSKAYLSGEMAAAALLLRGPAAYEKTAVETRTCARAAKVDRHNKQVALESGEVLDYHRLVLATGGRPRMMRVPGAELNNIFYLRTIADVEALRPAFVAGKRLVIVGGGYVGLEVAAVAVKTGLDVTVLEGATRVLARVTSPEMSDFYQRAHTAQGVRIRTGVTVSGFSGAAGDAASVGSVECGEAESVPADLVIVGIGLIPNTDLAEMAGLLVDNGILVNEQAQTSDPHIYAIGDCAAHAHHGFLRRKVRLESVPNAIEQARTAAADICGNAPPVVTPPWFWSDQYKLKLQMVGLSEDYDELVIRGDIQGESFITFYLREGEIISADAVNRLGEFMVAKRFVAERRRIPAAALADESQPLKTLTNAGS
jgi:3-phenylpropionate/trans-cinnamate dioxygenase ferredoxin reductase subunit